MEEKKKNDECDSDNSNVLTFFARSGKCFINNRIGVSRWPVTGDTKLCCIASIQRSQPMITSATSLLGWWNGIGKNV